MTTTPAPTIQCNNKCSNIGRNVLEAMTAAEMSEKIQSIVEKYEGRLYTRGSSEFIHVTDFGDFHYCLSCIRYINHNLILQKKAS